MIYRKCDDVTKIFLNAWGNERLEIHGEYLVLLDNCCNSPVTNQNALLRQISENRKSNTETLGGGYKAPFTGHSTILGNMDLDEHVGMTVLSQRKLEKLGASVRKSGDKYLLKFPECPVTIEFTWIEDILAGSCKELVDYVIGTETKKRNYATWTAQDTDEPSDLLTHYKLVPDMSNAEIRRLDMVHRALKTLWSPSEADLVQRLKTKLLKADFNEEDVRRYYEVFKYDLGALKGKAQGGSHDIKRSNETHSLIENEMILYCDLYFICGIPFLLTVDSIHSFVTSTCLRSRESSELMRGLNNVKSFYLSKGYKVKILEFDKEPGVSSTDVYNALGLELVPRSTHVSQAEVNIKTVKQRVRTALAMLTYTPTKTMLIELVIGATMISNTITREKLSGACPQQSLLGVSQSMKGQFSFCPSDYVEVHCKTDNDVQHRRTTSAIPLHPTANNLNEWVFLSLESGKTFVRAYDDAYIMPMTRSIVDRISYLGVQDPILGDVELNVIGTDTSYIPRFLQPVHKIKGRPKRTNVILDANVNEAAENAADNFLKSYFNDECDWEEDQIWIPPKEDEYNAMTNEPEPGDMMSVDSKGRSNYMCTSKDDKMLCYASHMTANESKKLFGEALTTKSIETEIVGLLERNAILPVTMENFDWSSKKVIPMSLFLKDKLDSDTGEMIKLKARLVAGGHRQDRSLYPTERRSSPTVQIQSIFTMLSIAASENRHVMTFDVAMAFLEAEIDEEIYMMLDKVTTATIIKLHPHLATMVRNGKLLVKLMKALYGCVQSSKLWYDRIKNFLQNIEFTCNPMDQCVFNRTSALDGSQCTIGLHVDDGLVTCANIEELTLLEKQLREEFDIEVHKGPTVKYLGMKVDFTDDTCKLTMRNYIDELLKDSCVKSLANSPAAHNLFDIDDTSERLCIQRSEKFHSVVASLLYLATRARPDIMLPVVFLCSRVGISTKDDDKKLMRIMAYLNATIDLPYILGRKGDPVILNCYADASFAVHKDFKSHGSILLSCGHGFIWSKCGKHKLVTKSSTEAELVTLSDAVSMTAWVMQFLKAQGYDVRGNLYQDNLSTIALANNGRSTSDRTRHINIRYFFIKQYLEDGTMTVEHCPATEMIADILTKPLQGYEFIKMRDLLLGHNRHEFAMRK